jgi:hypothetical protein
MLTHVVPFEEFTNRHRNERILTLIKPSQFARVAWKKTSFSRCEKTQVSSVEKWFRLLKKWRNFWLESLRCSKWTNRRTHPVGSKSQRDFLWTPRFEGRLTTEERAETCTLRDPTRRTGRRNWTSEFASQRGYWRKHSWSLSQRYLQSDRLASENRPRQSIPWWEFSLSTTHGISIRPIGSNRRSQSNVVSIVP